MAGLKWRDLSRNYLTIYGKGGKTRVIPLPEKVLMMLLALPKEHEFIFPSRSGRQLQRCVIHDLIKAYAKKAGVNEKISCHWLRHTHATTALEKGCDINLLSQSLGHSNIAVTSRYLHARPDKHSSMFFD